MRFVYRSKTFEIKGISDSDHIYSNIVRSGTFYEIDLLEYIYRMKAVIRRKNQSNVVVDVGANIGNHSVFFANFLADQLIAIEPNPQVLSTLRINLDANATHYALYEHAVGEKKSRGKLSVPVHMGENVGAARIAAQDSDVDVKISTLDSTISAWANNNTNKFTVCLLKIDVEGMEPQVLSGAKETIRLHHPHIFVEAASKADLASTQDFLMPLGYKRMPGHWAATPVYHFVYRPSLLLRGTSLIGQVGKLARKLKRLMLGARKSLLHRREF